MTTQAQRLLLLTTPAPRQRIRKTKEDDMPKTVTRNSRVRIGNTTEKTYIAHLVRRDKSGHSIRLVEIKAINIDEALTKLKTARNEGLAMIENEKGNTVYVPSLDGEECFFEDA
jgi:hypothetical protein